MPQKTQKKHKFNKDTDFLVFNEKCVGCSYCVLACSVVKFQAMDMGRAFISVERDHDQPSKERYAVRFKEECDSCGYCLEFCYFDAIRNIHRPHLERVTLPPLTMSKTYTGG